MPSSRAAQRAWGCVGVAVLLAGCGAAGAPRPSPATAEPLHYDTRETPEPVLGAREPAAITRALAFAARDLPSAPRGDGRLALLARTCLRAGCSQAALVAEARKLGLLDVRLELHLVGAERADLLPAALAASLSAPLQALAATHAGAFVEPGGSRASVVISRRPLALAPLPRRVAPGGQLRLRGTLAGRFSELKLRVAGPSGETWLPAGAGPAIDLQVELAQPGCYALTLFGRAEGGSEPVAALVAHAGKEAGPFECARDPSAAARAEGRERIERELLTRIAELRAAQGLPSLALDRRLVQRATSAAVERAATPAAVAAASGVPGGLARLAHASGRSAAELWRGLEVAPARSALLEPSATHVGIGVVAAETGWIAAALVAQLAAPADVERVPSQVLDALNRNRSARSAPALHPDPTLTAAARRAVRAFFVAPALDEREIVTRTNAELERFGLHYRRIGALAVLVADPLEAAALEPALDPDARAVGVAAATGMRPGSDQPSLAVVIALGWER